MLISELEISPEKLAEMREYHKSQYPPLRPTDIVIEIDEHRKIVRPDVIDPVTKMVKKVKPMHAGNSPVQFPPVDRSRDRDHRMPNGLRSRYIPMRFAGNVHVKILRLLAFEFIPGEQITLNLDLREGRVRDEMGQPEREPLLRELQELAREHAGYAGTPLPDLVFSAMSDEDMWNWKYWMRRLITPTIHADGSEWHYAVAIQNEHLIPTLDECCASGRIRLQRDHPASHYIQPEEFYCADGTLPVQRTLRDKDIPLIEELLGRD